MSVAPDEDDLPERAGSRMKLSGEFCSELYALARHQNGRNVRVEIDGMPVLIVQRLEDADRVLRTNAANYAKNLTWFRQILGASRLTEEGESWRIRQELTQHYFNTFDRQRNFDLCRTHCERALRAMVAGGAQGAGVIDDAVFHDLTVSVMMEGFFDLKPGDAGIDLSALAGLIELGSLYALKRPGSNERLPRERLLQLPKLRKAVLDSLRVFRAAPLAENSMIAGMLRLDSDESSDFILEHELVTFFIGGSEAPASALGWACYLLALYPQVQDELRQALQSFWALPAPDYAQLAKVTPLGNFVSEVLRLFPPVPALARLSIGADHIGEDRIEPGEHVAISVIGMQHDQRFRSDPWTLDIGDAARMQRAAGALTSFGAGPRICGGKQFALAELTSILSVFLREAQFELTSDAEPSFCWRSQMIRRGRQPVRVQWLEKHAEASQA
jgi:cytochrome P450